MVVCSPQQICVLNADTFHGTCCNQGILAGNMFSCFGFTRPAAEIVAAVLIMSAGILNLIIGKQFCSKCEVCMWKPFENVLQRSNNLIIECYFLHFDNIVYDRLFWMR